MKIENLHPSFENPATYYEYKKLARELGWAEPTISGWRTKGIPTHVRAALDRIIDLMVEIESEPIYLDSFPIEIQHKLIRASL